MWLGPYTIDLDEWEESSTPAAMSNVAMASLGEKPSPRKKMPIADANRGCV